MPRLPRPSIASTATVGPTPEVAQAKRALLEIEQQPPRQIELLFKHPKTAAGLALGLGFIVGLVPSARKAATVAIVFGFKQLLNQRLGVPAFKTK